MESGEIRGMSTERDVGVNEKGVGERDDRFQVKIQSV